MGKYKATENGFQEDVHIRKAEVHIRLLHSRMECAILDYGYLCSIGGKENEDRSL